LLETSIDSHLAHLSEWEGSASWHAGRPVFDFS
jgi:hypothetical protein